MQVSTFASQVGSGDQVTSVAPLVQENGVDEADIVKTDGKYVYTINGRNLVVLKSWPIEVSEMTP